MVMFTFSVLDRFWANFLKKSNLSVYVENWNLDQIEYAEFNDGLHFFCFRLEAPFLGKFGSKDQNCQFKLKFDT